MSNAMIPDWNTTCCWFSGLLEEQHPALLRELARTLESSGTTVRIIPGTRDIWARDYMPVQVDEGTFCKFIYNPNYLKNHQSLITSARACRLKCMAHYRRVPLVLDGGNIVCSQYKVILTDNVYRENPSVERKQVRQMLEAAFCAEVVIIPKEPHDWIGHADGVVRFLDEDRVVINGCSRVAPEYGGRLKAKLKRHRLSWEEICYLHDDSSDESAVGNYVNFLRTGSVLIVPAYGLPQDDRACRMLEKAIPGASISQARCEDLAVKGGVLNCISWTARVRGDC